MKKRKFPKPLPSSAPVCALGHLEVNCPKGQEKPPWGVPQGEGFSLHKFQFAVLIPTHSRCGGCATGDSFSASGQTRFRLRRPLGSALRSGAISLLRSPPRYNSRCGTLAAGSLSPATAPTNIRGFAPAWFVGIRSGLSSPAHGLRAINPNLPCLFPPIHAPAANSQFHSAFLHSAFCIFYSRLQMALAA